MEGNPQLPFPEEDDELEALRMAALETLKKKGETQGGPKFFNGSPRTKKRAKFNGRPRNGQFNGWTRNSNLIAVPMVTEEKIETVTEDIPKLILPQDRYCKLEKSPDKNDNVSTKFDRYDNSDRSDSDSEEETQKSGTQNSNLKRSNSLEALMAELENEIQGGPPQKSEEKPIVVTKPKKRRKSIVGKSDEKPLEENLKRKVVPSNNFRARKWQNKAPPRRVNQPFVPPPVALLPPVSLPELGPPPVVAFAPPPVPVFPPPFNPITNVYAPPVLFEAPPPPIHIRPLSPLLIGDFGGPHVGLGAPLSPRSAAFVMENRAIVEKRKRRSWSRSPSPARFRRSISPKRLSLSPKRASRSPVKRRSFSPSPVRTSSKPPTSVHTRLGTKRAPEPTEEEPKKDEEPPKTIDPILEARRRKFERNDPITAGVIRLKKPEDEEGVKEEEFNEDALLINDEEDDTILLDHNDLFSDEESESDNEGRFKTKETRKVAVLPFTQLINGSKNEIKKDLSEKKKRKVRSRSPAKKKSKVSTRKSERKIEIKIRNPAKYEKSEEKVGRKVEVVKKQEIQEKEDDASLTDGDLRTQLSRKRAERQKLPDIVPSRLIQNALECVGFKKNKKAVSKEEDSKRPIHARLGTSSETFGKSRKANKGSPEQV